MHGRQSVRRSPAYINVLTPQVAQISPSLLNVPVAQLPQAVRPFDGAMEFFTHVVHDEFKLSVFVYCPIGHFGQMFAWVNAQDPSDLVVVASEPESFKKVPGLQHSTRFPGGSTRVGKLFQLGEHHTPCRNAATFPANIPSKVLTLNMSHVDKSWLKARAFLNV